MTPVTRIDHLVVPVEDPDDLFDLFTQRLGLPSLWPVTDLGPFRSAGVGAGNCWIEIVADADSLTPVYEARLPAVFRGIAFEASEPCDKAAALLDAARLERGEVESWSGRRPDGSEGPLVTVLPVGGLIGDAGIAYLCEMALPVAPERVAQRTAKAAAQPGALGVTGIAEIQIGLRDPDAAAERWTTIAGPPVDGAWHPGDGPSVRITESPIDGVSGIVATVASLDAARDALKAKGLLGPMRGTGVGINHAAAHGLDIWFREQRTTDGA